MGIVLSFASTSSPETSAKRCLRFTSEAFSQTPPVLRYAPVLVLMTAEACPQLLTVAPD